MNRMSSLFDSARRSKKYLLGVVTLSRILVWIGVIGNGAVALFSRMENRDMAWMYPLFAFAGFLFAIRLKETSDGLLTSQAMPTSMGNAGCLFYGATLFAFTPLIANFFPSLVVILLPFIGILSAAVLLVIGKLIGIWVIPVIENLFPLLAYTPAVLILLGLALLTSGIWNPRTTEP